MAYYRTLFRRISSTEILAHLRDPLHRSGYALTFGSAVTSAIGFFYWIIAARYYPADVVGENSAAIAAMSFLAGLAVLYLDGTLIRFIPRAGQSTAKLIGYIYIITSIVAALTAGGFLWGLQIWSPGLSFLLHSPATVFAFIGATTLWCFYTVQESALIGLRQATWVPFVNSFYAVAKLVLLIIFSYTLSEYGIITSWVVPVVVLIVPMSYIIFRRMVLRHTQITRAIAQPIAIKEIAVYASGNYISTLFSLAYVMLPPVMVLSIAGSKASAYFYIPWVIAGLLRVLATNMSTSLTVEGVLDRTRLVRYLRHSLISTARIIIPIAVILTLSAPYLLSVFGAEYSSEGTPLLRLLVLSTIPNIVVPLYLGYLRVQNRIGVVIIVHGLNAVVTLGLSFIWLPAYGITGIGLAWLVSQFVIALFIILTGLRPILSGSTTAVQL